MTRSAFSSSGFARISASVNFDLAMSVSTIGRKDEV